MSPSIILAEQQTNRTPPSTTEDLETKQATRGERQEGNASVLSEQQEIFAYLFRITADLPAEALQRGETMEIVLSPAWQKLSREEKMKLVTTPPIQGRVHNIMHNASLQDIRKVKAYLSDPTTPDLDPRTELMGLWIKSKRRQPQKPC